MGTRRAVSAPFNQGRPRRMELTLVSTTDKPETSGSKTRLPGLCPIHKRQLGSRQPTETQTGLALVGSVSANANIGLRGKCGETTFPGGREEHCAVQAISGIVGPPVYLPFGLSLISCKSFRVNRMCWGPKLEVKEQVNCTSLN